MLARVRSALICHHDNALNREVLHDNLARLAKDLQQVHAGKLEPLDVSGPSAVWGRPRLMDHLRWKRATRRDGTGR
jgi:hypothetical protein